MTNPTENALRIAYRTAFWYVIVTGLVNIYSILYMTIAFFILYRFDKNYHNDKAAFLTWARQPFNLKSRGLFVFALLWIAFFVYFYIVMMGIWAEPDD